MDGDSNFGGSDVTHDSGLGHDNNSLETTVIGPHDRTGSSQSSTLDTNSSVISSPNDSAYFKNEITLPINYNDESDADKLPHYLSTAKLNIDNDEEDSNLEESSKNYTSTHKLDEETPKTRRKSGIDNLAYQEEDTKPSNGALKSSFGDNKAFNNGDLNSSVSLGLTSPTKIDEPLNEAVNLELINLKPTGKDVIGPYENGNGVTDIPVKKGTEVEIGNPYDEYFVPVNEHRKYMRGEKLYVTKDKRDKKKRNKCLCWGICFVIVAAAVIVGILAAVGVIGSPEAQPVQEARHFGSSQKNDDGEVKSAGGLFGLSGSDTSKAHGTYPPTPGPPISTVSSILPSTDTSMIEVPRALDSHITIDNMQFLPELANKSSLEYKQLADILERELKKILLANSEINKDTAIELKIMELSPGSVVVKFRVGWLLKNGEEMHPDLVTKEMLENSLQKALADNFGYVREYHVPESTVMASKIINMCQIDKNGCEHNCLFDYQILDFICTCPQDQVLDVDGKRCTEPKPSTESEMPDFDFGTIPELEAKPEPTSQDDPTKHQKETTLESVSKSEPIPMYTSEQPKRQVESEIAPTTHQPHIEAKYPPHTEPQPSIEPELELQPSIEPEVTPHPEPHPTIEPELTSQQNIEPELSPQPNIEPEATPEPHPNIEPKTTLQPESQPTKYSINSIPITEIKATTIKEEDIPDYITTVQPEPRRNFAREGKIDNREYIIRIPHVETTTPVQQTTRHVIPEADYNTTTMFKSDEVTEFSKENRLEIVNTSVLNGSTESFTRNMFEASVIPIIHEEVKNESSSAPQNDEHYTQLPMTLEESHTLHDNFIPPTNSSTMTSTTQSSIENETIREHTINYHVEAIQNVEQNKVTTSKSAENDFLNTVTPLVLQNKTESLMTTTPFPTTLETFTEKPKNEMEKIMTTLSTIGFSENDKNKTKENTEGVLLMSNMTNESLLQQKTANQDNILESTTLPQTTQSQQENWIPVVIHSSLPMAIDDNNSTHLTPQTTHHHSTIIDTTEITLDMSPFLPEIENDTLHMVSSDVERHNDAPVEHHDEDHMFHHTILPPRLDIDEMNVTNPIDPMPKEGEFTVTPIPKNNSTESMNEFSGRQFPDEIITYMSPIEIANTADQSKELTTYKYPYVKKDEPEVKPSKENKPEPTLSPDIINNVHSNDYFLRLQTSTPKILKTTLHFNNNIPDASTEDLLALETTTNNLDEEIMKVFGNATTVHAEIVNSATDTVHFIHSEIEKPNHTTQTFDLATELENFTNMLHHSDLAVVPLTENERNTSTEQFNANSFDTTAHPTTIKTINVTEELSKVTEIIMNKEGEITTILPRLHQTEKVQQYEVQENLSDDFTTTSRGLFNYTTLPSKLNPDNTEISENDPLPVIPLEENHNSSEILRDDNKLDSFYDSNDFVNDISDEEKNVLDKFAPTKQSETEINPYLTNKPVFTTTLKIYTGPDDIKPVTEGFTLNGFSRCNTGQFQCHNGTAIKDGSYCIPLQDQCDSVDDCSDASDEVGCNAGNCFTNFQCANGQCLKRNLVCNGIADCTDSSDEINCESRKCNSDEFSCGNGRCIPLIWKCDGLQHCPNGEDELKCNFKSCISDTFECADQEMCVPISWTCDGKPDCIGHDDESFCTCNESHFKCTQGGGCIPGEQRCDGVEQCADLSDEWNCVRLQEQDGQSSHVNFVEILSNNQTWIQVCSDLWNNSHSEAICQSMGYAGATSTDFLPVEPQNTITSKFYTLNPQHKHGSRLLAQLQKTDSCKNVVSIGCQEFECGSYASFESRTAGIIGGNSTTVMQWPSLMLLYNKVQHRRCTATLVAPSWVIANYDCVESKNINEWTLYAGGANFLTHSVNADQIRFVKRIVRHPQAKFSQFFYSKDLVLVELKTPLILSHNVSAICLPDKDIEPKQVCVTSGWGMNNPGDTNMQQYLSYLPSPTIDINECNSTKHYNGYLTDDKICAAHVDSNESPCYNDEGEPLMCLSDPTSTWELHGLLSYHGNCGRNHHPAIYTAINKDTRQWIMNTIGLNTTHKKSRT